MADVKVESIQPFRFLDLPSELRIAIYELVVRPEPNVQFFSSPAYQAVTRHEHRGDGYGLAHLEVQLLRTCRQINKEASDVLYCSGARFHVHDELLTSVDHLRRFTDPKVAVAIPRDRIVHLNIYIFIQQVGRTITYPEVLPPPFSALKDVRIAVVGTASRFRDTVPAMSLGHSVTVIQKEILRIMELLPSNVNVEAEQGLRDRAVFQYVDDFRLDRVYPAFSASPPLVNVLQVEAELVSNAIAMYKNHQGAGLIQHE